MRKRARAQDREGGGIDLSDVWESDRLGANGVGANDVPYTGPGYSEEPDCELLVVAGLLLLAEAGVSCTAFRDRVSYSLTDGLT
jgi:hypothetical protein